MIILSNYRFCLRPFFPSCRLPPQTQGLRGPPQAAQGPRRQQRQQPGGHGHGYGHGRDRAGRGAGAGVVGFHHAQAPAQGAGRAGAAQGRREREIRVASLAFAMPDFTFLELILRGGGWRSTFEIFMKCLAFGSKVSYTFLNL